MGNVNGEFAERLMWQGFFNNVIILHCCCCFNYYTTCKTTRVILPPQIAHSKDSIELYSASVKEILRLWYKKPLYIRGAVNERYDNELVYDIPLKVIYRGCRIKHEKLRSQVPEKKQGGFLILPYNIGGVI